MKASRVLIIIVCLVTSLVFVVVYVCKYVYQKDLLPSTASVTQSYAAASSPEPSSVDETPLPTVTYTAFPRMAYTYDGVTVGLTGTKGKESVLDYYAFVDYVFCILTTDTDGEDYRAENVSLAVARFDTSCTLTDTVTLPKSFGYTYLCAGMYDYGIMIAASSSTDIRVWTVSVNLVVHTVAYPYVVHSARMVYADGAQALLAAGEKLHFILLDSDLRIVTYHTAPVNNQQLVEVYRYNDRFVALCTDRNAGAAYIFDKNGYRSKCILPSVSAVTPYEKGYAIASCEEGKLYLFDYDFTRQSEQTVPRSSSVALCSYDKGILLLCGTVGYLICNHGDVQYSFTMPYPASSALFYAGDRFYYTACASASTSIYSYLPFASSPLLVTEYVGADSPKVWTTNGYLYCLCASSFDYGYYSGTLGGEDVYLLRSAFPY